jgi:hypothetical protein
MENVEMYNEYHQLVYDGDFETLLEEFDYNEELEYLLNKLQSKDIKQGIFVNDDCEKYLLIAKFD